MFVDPRFYVVHVIFFTLGAVLFGIFAHALRKEVSQHKWTLAPRTIWLSCLCCSSFGYLIIQIDPVGAMGIFSDPWQMFVGQIDASLLVVSVCASAYMYLLVSYKRNAMPVLVTHGWVGANVASVLAISIFALAGATTNNSFWIAMCMLVLGLQEICLYTGLVITVFKTIRVLNSMQQITDYSKQIRKLWFLLVAGTMLIGGAMANQVINLRIPIDSWGVPIPVTALGSFRFSLIFADLTTLISHLLLASLMLRPSNNKNNSRDSEPKRMVRLGAGKGRVTIEVSKTSKSSTTTSELATTATPTATPNVPKEGLEDRRASRQTNESSPNLAPSTTKGSEKEEGRASSQQASSNSMDEQLATATAPANNEDIEKGVEESQNSQQ